MQIVSSEWHTVTVGLAPGGAARQRTQRVIGMLRVTTAAGVVGYGEASPLDGSDAQVSGDLAQTCARVASHAPFTVEGAARTYVLAHQLAPSASTRFALETALLDAWCKQQQLGLAAALVAAPVTTLPCAAVVDDVAQATASVQAGFGTLKVKLDQDIDACDRRLAKIRAAVGPLIKLRGDVNGGWTIEQTPGNLRRLAAHQLEFVEEPCPLAFRLLAMQLPIPIALDESLATMPKERWQSLDRAASLWGVVLKPTVLGGMVPALGLAKFAIDLGANAIVTHALEGPLGTRACVELARAVASFAQARSLVAVGLGNNPSLALPDASWSLSAPHGTATIVTGGDGPADQPADGPGLGAISAWPHLIATS